MSWTAKKNTTSRGEMKNVKNYVPRETVQSVQELPFVDIIERGISKTTCEYFGVRCSLSEEDGKTVTAVYFPYRDQQGKITGYKKRDFTVPKEDDYHFTVVGKVNVSGQMFGQWEASQNDRSKAKSKLVISEGEFDAMAYYQAYVENINKTKWKGVKPFIVSISLGTGNAVDSVLSNLSFVREFEGVITAFDNDSASPSEARKGIIKGKEAAEKVASAIMTDVKVFIYDVPHNEGKTKDVNDLLLYTEDDSWVKNITFNARVFSGEKIISAKDIPFERVIAKRPEGIGLDMYPKLKRKTRGLRKRELWLVTAPSGAGKSTLLGHVEHDLLERGEKLALIRLEEENGETLQRLVANKLKVNFNLFKDDPLSCASEDLIRKAYGECIDEDRLMILDHFGSIDLDSLMEKIKILHYVHKCNWIVLDHLSMVISGLDLDNERKALDMVMTELAAFVASHDVGIIVVSHINREAMKGARPPKGKENEPFFFPVAKESLRGSAALEQLSWMILAIEPEINLKDKGRGRSRLVVLKNRPCSYLGICDVFRIDEKTGEVILDEDEMPMIDFN